ncbi:hypothetical protein GOD17_31675 [Sinorhizobium medicae]|nr:hypothetical protein [Sinorhizobium medicae]
MTIKSLTYAELAARLGVKPESARRLAQRRKWQRTIGNDGAARVFVPIDALPSPATSSVTSPRDTDNAENSAATDTHDDAGDVTRDNPAAVAVLEAQIEGLKALLAAEARRAEAAERERDDWKAEAAAWQAHAQRGFLRRLFG